MLAEICNLLTKFLQADESLMLSLMSRDRCFIEILVNTLDWRLFGEYFLVCIMPSIPFVLN